MTIKATEVGKLFNYGTFYDLTTGGATLELKITHPDGTEATIPNARISTPATDITDSELGTLPGNTYMQFETEATDFPVAGEYMICGTYQDASPKIFYGDDATFTIGEKC